jgi:hypothetical protein
VTLKNLFTATAVLTLIFALGFLLVPRATSAPYGYGLDEAGVHVARSLGAAYLGLAALAWLARNTPDSEARRAIVLCFLIINAIGVFAALPGKLSGVTNALGWSTPLIHILLVLGFGYFAFFGPDGR